MIAAGDGSRRGRRRLDTEMGHRMASCRMCASTHEEAEFTYMQDGMKSTFLLSFGK